MSRPTMHTECDKCGTENVEILQNLQKTLTVTVSKGTTAKAIYTEWLPKGWNRHTTEKNDYETNIFVLCNSCEEQFQHSIEQFKPREV